MAGALAERVFADKIRNVGLMDFEVHERRPFSLDDAARYPLFTPDLIELMSTMLPPHRRGEVAVALTVSAHKPA